MRIIKLPEVSHLTARKRSTIYSDIAKGIFPKPVPLGGGRVGWLEHEVQDWIAQRVSLRDIANT